jgi:phosphoglycolate phosphatase
VVDIISGKKAGAQTVGVLCGFGEELELRKAGADLILDTTADLMKLFTPGIDPLVREDGSGVSSGV